MRHGRTLHVRLICAVTAAVLAAGCAAAPEPDVAAAATDETPQADSEPTATADATAQPQEAATETPDQCIRRLQPILEVADFAGVNHTIGMAIDPEGYEAGDIMYWEDTPSPEMVDLSEAFLAEAVPYYTDLGTQVWAWSADIARWDERNTPLAGVKRELIRFTGTVTETREAIDNADFDEQDHGVVDEDHRAFAQVNIAVADLNEDLIIAGPYITTYQFPDNSQGLTTAVLAELDYGCWGFRSIVYAADEDVAIEAAALDLYWWLDAVNEQQLDLFF